jgi:hypothetical protein
MREEGEREGLVAVIVTISTKVSHFFCTPRYHLQNILDTHLSSGQQ